MQMLLILIGLLGLVNLMGVVGLYFIIDIQSKRMDIISKRIDDLVVRRLI